MVEGGKARLVKMEPGEARALCVFETVARMCSPGQAAVTRSARSGDDGVSAGDFRGYESLKYLPPELKPFVTFLDDLPNLDKTVFLYRLCLLMRTAGKMRIINTAPRDDFSVVYFETRTGFRFPVFDLYLDRVTHLDILKRIKPLLDEAEKIVAKV
jgi:hypothetical protein